MKKECTELVFLLDRSGSMSGLEEDTIGGYNAMLNRQKGQPGNAVVTTVLFDDSTEFLHLRVPVMELRPLTERDYAVGGSTALLDAMGKTICKMDAIQKKQRDSERAQGVLFVIITDGLENASQEYRFDAVQALVERQKKRYGWEFLFLGANMDAMKAAAQVGISADCAANYNPDGAGIRLNFEAVCAAACQVRAGKPLDQAWKAQVQKDVQERGGAQIR